MANHPINELSSHHQYSSTFLPLYFRNKNCVPFVPGPFWKIFPLGEDDRDAVLKLSPSVPGPIVNFVDFGEASRVQLFWNCPLSIQDPMWTCSLGEVGCVQFPCVIFGGISLCSLHIAFWWFSMRFKTFWEKCSPLNDYIYHFQHRHQ